MIKFIMPISSTRNFRCISLLFLVMLFIPFTGNAQQAVPDPDPHRFVEEIETFSTWDAKNSFPLDAILFVGSSSIRFWHTHQAFPEYRVINRGFGGSHISDINHFYEEVISKYDPSAIVFYAGDNDVAADKPVNQVLEDYYQLLDRVRKDYPNIQWVYVPIKPSSSRWSYWQKMHTVNERIQEHHRKYPLLHYIDLATPLLTAEGKPDDSFFLEDQLHLNEKGYEVWNRIMGKKLEEMKIKQ